MEQSHNERRPPRRQSSGSSSRPDKQRSASASQQGGHKRRRPSSSAQRQHASTGSNPRPRSGQTGEQRRQASSQQQQQRRRNAQKAHRNAQTRAHAQAHTATGARTQHKSPAKGLPVSPAVIGMGVAGVAIVCVIGWLIFGLITRFKVTVNGQEVTLDRGATVQTLLDKEYASPQPGDLLDVDGKLLTTGGGAVCTATVNGNEATVETALEPGNVVVIEDGGDLTEDADVEEETIKAEQDEGDRSFEAYWYGSIHLLSDGEDGVKTTKTGKVSGKTVTEVTKEPINAGYRIYTAQPDDKVIALTFDDGPWPKTTDQILDILEEYDAKATFFTIGEQIANEPDAVKRAHEMGCQICTHTWDHAAGSGGGVSIATMSASEQVQEIQKGYDAIEKVLGEEPKHVLRAPGGNFFGDVIDNVWDVVDAEIGWDVDTEDWNRPGVDSIVQMILSVKPGQVILMHDGGGDREQTVEALRQAMPQLVEKGYKFVTVDELMAYGMPSKNSDIPTTSDDDIDTSSSSSSSSSITDDTDEDEDATTTSATSTKKTTTSSSTSTDEE